MRGQVARPRFFGGVGADDEEPRGHAKLNVGEVAPVRRGKVSQLHVLSSPYRQD